MKYIRQMLIILAFSFAGEVLHALLSLPIPAGIYGFLLLLLALVTHLLPLAAIWESGNWLLQIMPLLFIPAAVGLMDSWSSFSDILLPALLLILASTILVMAVCGRVCQWLLRRRERKNS